MQMALQGSSPRWIGVVSLASILLAGCGSTLNPASNMSGPSSTQATVPNVVGLMQSAATTAITGAGLVVGAVTDQSSSTVASGSVISETPAAGAQESAGSQVSLIVSSGPSQSGGSTPSPLSSANINLIFVVSEDLVYQASGDVNPQTANLTNQGLNRSLLMGKYLQQSVLGGNNVTAIYALEPASHLQTQSNFPDMAGLETIQQFALVNNITISSNAGGTDPLPGNSFQSTCRMRRSR